MKRTISRSHSVLALALAATMTVQQGRLAEAAPGDIFQTSAPVVGSDPPKAAEIQDGDASVASQTGALTFSYPISVPPGRQGMQPHVALSYSSQAPIYGGIAAGWSLSIPIITEDTAKGRLVAHTAGTKVYKSSLAGDRPLVRTSEGTGTYRAQNDSTFQRYVKVVPSTGYQWVVYTTDGQVHYFGDSSHTATCTIISDGYAPLTRSVDPFGNTVDYYYELGADSECRISSISWGENANAGLGSFATLNFSYSIANGCSPPAGVPGPPTATPPIGSQTSYRTGTKIVTGASELDLITINAITAAERFPEHTRLITLAYDANEKSCTASHAAYRALHSIQESAYGVDSPRVDLPAEIFTYGNSSLMTTYPGETTQAAPWTSAAPGEGDEPQLTNNLSWGYRPVDGRYPTVEATMVDMDGDGLLDRLTNYPAIDAQSHVLSCGAAWQRNKGNMQFDTTLHPVTLPTLKWATIVGGTSYVGGGWANANINLSPTVETCALNYQLTAYINGGSRVGSTNGSTVCADQGNEGSCTNGVCPNGADCSDKSPLTNYTTLVYRWFDIDGDGLTDLVVSPAQGSYGLYDLQWGRGFTVAGTVPHEPELFGHDFATGTNTAACTFPSFSANPLAGRYTMCGGMYPWFIYRNHGNGVFASMPDAIKYQPIPLDPDNGNSSMVSNVITETQGNLDVDGDGFPDAIVGGGSAWAVYRNDGTGQLAPMNFLSAPFSWPAGANDTLTSTKCPAVTGPCSPYQSSGLFDANGDGLVDQWDALGSGSAAAANVEYNDGTSFRAPGGTGELVLSARPAMDGLTSVQSGEVIAGGKAHGNTFWIYLGNRSDTFRTFDLDLDGRPDLVRGPNMLTTFNQGGQFGASSFAPGDANALKHWIVASNVDQYTWEVRADMVDLDGDGIPEAFNMGTGTFPTSFSVARISTTQPPRLLTRIDNGRGAHTDVTYSSMNSATVTQDPLNGKVMPHTSWVVSTLATTESIPTTTTATTAFHYNSPRYLADERGLYGFRGFDEVDTTLPTGAVKVDRYSYSPDWSGRLAQTLMKPSEAPSEVRSIDTTSWVAKGLFCDASNLNCAVTSYHAQSQQHLTCKNGMLESNPGDLTHQCDAAHAPYTATTTTWSACNTTKGGSFKCDLAAVQSPSSVLWLPTRTLLQSSTAPANGDRRTSTSYAVWSDAQTYRVKPLVATKEVQASGSFVVYDKTGNDWNQDPGLEYSLPVTDLVWFDNSNPICTVSSTNCAVTQHTYDLTTGNQTSRRKPVQSTANGPSETYDYDSRKLFISAEHTEPGGYNLRREETDFLYEYGTGTKLETKGPNIASCSGPPPYTSPTCPAGTTYLQDARIRVDGLGRTIDRWETYGGPDINNTYYRNFERERNTYIDTAPASAMTQSAIDYDASNFAVRFSLSKVDVDGHGRTIRKTLYALGAASADEITTYTYNNQGLLTAVTAPDPSQNSAATLVYTYSFDSLGRAASIRRPDAVSLTSQSGVNISYDGLSTTTSEVVGTSGGKPATTVSSKDSFGRLTTIAEQTGTSTFATATYTYDASDNVTQVTDPTAVVTSMKHDFAGRRTMITRSGRSWSYAYDKNGNRLSETFPGSQSQIQPDVNYMNVTTYDDMDYPMGTLVGQRGLSAPDAETLGANYHRYFYELGASSVGQLSDVETYAPSGATSTTTQFLYDLQGREELTYETYLGLPAQYRQTVHAFTLAGQPSATNYYDYPAPGRATYSNINYDNRGFSQSVDLSLSANVSNTTIAVQTRNVAGLVTKRHTDVVGSPMTFAESNWTYDVLGRVNRQVVQKGPGPTQVARQDLAYNGTDDPKSLDHWLGASNHKHYNYAFDYRHELTTVGETQLPNAFTASYTYNTAGRFLTAKESAATLPNSDVRPRNVSYKYDGVDPEEVTALTKVSGGATAWAFAYDAAGNETMRCSGAIVNRSCTGSDESDYVYDGDDHLRRASRRLGSAVQGSEEYWYDGRGNRNIVVKRDGTGAKTETIWFINDVEAHYDSADNWIHSYAHISLGTPVARVDTGTSYVGTVELQFHGLGNSTLATIDRTTGTTNAAFDYAPFGEIVEASDGGGAVAGVSAHRRRVNDKFVDVISGLTYYGARYFDQTTLTWTQADPDYRFAPESASSTPRLANLYTADLNNPLRLMDPDGRDPVEESRRDGESADNYFTKYCASEVATYEAHAALIDYFRSQRPPTVLESMAHDVKQASLELSMEASGGPPVSGKTIVTLFAAITGLSELSA
ncbi:MAG: toxin TcdB middle/N-terminal domain-containing protein, partial [Deltaproteobacteria bacterium]